jgi:hypothetical protein
MRLLDLELNSTVKKLSIYLTPEEAEWFKRELEKLIKDPEANEHFHIHSLDNSKREISCSIVTTKKLKDLSNYNKAEQNILNEK